MLGLNHNHLHRKISPELLLRCTISAIFGAFSQLSLLIIPHFLKTFSLFIQLILSGAFFFTHLSPQFGVEHLKLGFPIDLLSFNFAGFVLLIAIINGQLLRRLLRVRASAPAFVVFHVIFIWSIYIIVIRQSVSPLTDILFNGVMLILLVGFFKMLASDPGFVQHDSLDPTGLSLSEDGTQLEELSERARCMQSSSEEILSSGRRVRYCRRCEAYVMGFDHHCPAFGNCIGMRNHVQFVVLLLGFIVTEVLYSLLSYQWVQRHEISIASVAEITRSLAASTLFFSLFQVVWQVPFLAWHVYCACFNIKTDEWINWRRYPEFHVIAEPDQSLSEKRFRNPYHKGVFCNLKKFLQR